MISVIVNPIAGKGRAKQVLPEIQTYLTKHALPYTVHMTESQGDGVRCAKQALAEGCDRVLAVGGDGTAREVAEGLCRSNSVLGIVPAGTGNDFARTFHLSGELSKVLDIAVYGKGMPIDVFDTDSGIYINICSVGLDSEAAYNASKMHNVAGSVSYLLGALWALIRRRICKCELSIDDGPKQKQSNLLTAFCNGQYYGGGFRPVPSADPQDGWMDVLTVDKMGRLQAIPLLAKYKKGTHVGHKKTHICKAKKISLTSKQLLCINLDGEIMHSHTLNLSLIPQALLIAQSELITE